MYLTTISGKIERPLYATAAIAGLRQGELIALRRRDVDFKTGVIRIRRNYTRGRFGTPKSRRSSRAVPMAKAVAEDLRHTFGTRMAAAGAPLRNIQEWMGHRDYKTTEIYADYAPDPQQEAKWVDAAFSDEDGGSSGSEAGTSPFLA